MTEDERKRTNLIATINDTIVKLGGDFKPVNRDKLAPMLTPELEVLANQIGTAKTANEAILMLGHAATKSRMDEQARFEASTTPATVSMDL